MADQEIVGGGCGRVAGGEGVGCGKGIPPHGWRGLGRGLCPRNYFHFGPQNGQFRCIVGAGVGMHPHPLWIRHCLGISEFF